MIRLGLLSLCLLCSGCVSWSGIAEYARPHQASAWPSAGSEDFIRWTQSTPF